MKLIFKSSLKLSIKLIVVVLLDFFLVVSMTVLCSMVFTENIGYEAYGYIEDGEESEYLYTYNNDDGKDLKKEEYESKGYTLTFRNLRSPLTPSGRALYMFVSQFFAFVILTVFVYMPNYDQGFKDSRSVRHGIMKEDLFKGFKIGAIANIPFFLMFIALIVCAAGAFPDLPVSTYRLFNSQYYIIIELVAGTLTASQLGFAQYLILFILQLIVPAISAVSYIMGYKGIDVAEKFIYAKKG